MGGERDEREERDSLIGQAIGGYVLERVLGEGGMGVVYLGVHRTLHKRMAVKVIGSGGLSADARSRFLEEGRLAASLDHPAIVEVNDLATLPDGRLYMVMEFLDGESLAHLHRRRGALPPGEAVAIVAEALAGLAVAHARGIVHRDIKPANVFVVRAGDRGHVKILDFGLAKLNAVPSPNRTQTGAIIGTPGYMAPEQIGGKPADARADVYGAGAMLYELIAGHPAFEHDDWVELLQRQRLTDPPPLAQIDVALRDVVSRALSREPSARFADASAMREALVAAVGGTLAPIPLPEPTAIVHEPASEPSEAQPSTRMLRRGSDASAPTKANAPTKRETPHQDDRRSDSPPSSRRRWVAAGALAAAGLASVGIGWNMRGPTTTSHRDLAPVTADHAAPPVLATPSDAALDGSVQVATVVADAAVPDAPPRRIARTDAGIARTSHGTEVAQLADAATSNNDTATTGNDAEPAAPTYFTEDPKTIPDAKSFELIPHIAYAQGFARRVFADAKLISMSGPGLRPDGTFDLTNESARADYYFRSEAHSKGAVKRAYNKCLVYVSLASYQIQVGVQASDDCLEPYFVPHCTGKQLVAKARELGAQTEGLATLHFYQLAGGPTWRVGFDRDYDIKDADCAH